MSGIGAIGGTIGTICVAAGMISVLIPQKRTRKIMSFVLGVFFIGALLNGISAEADRITLDADIGGGIDPAAHSEAEYDSAVAQLTADYVTQAVDELLRQEGVAADDIQITLKITDDGRIYAVRAVIYISEAYAQRIGDIESIVYRNLSKEPEVYVTGQEVQ